MTTVASSTRRNRPPLDSSQAAAIFAAMGVPEVDDRPEVDRLLSTVHAGVRTVWRSVRCFGASEAAVAAHTRIRPEKVAEYPKTQYEDIGFVPGLHLSQVEPVDYKESK